MDPTRCKPWYLSKGFVGPLVTAILFALRSTGVADIDTDTALGMLYQGAEFLGIAAGMLGRAVAETRITAGGRGACRAPVSPSSVAGGNASSEEPVR